MSINSWPTGPVSTSLATVEVTPDIAGTGVTLFIDGTESSHHHLTDPTNLAFEYMQYMQAALLTHFGSGGVVPGGSADGPGRLRALHIGAAGCTMARAINAHWPTSHQVAIEPDELLATLVREWFDLPRSPHLRIRVQDGLAALRSAPESRYEIIIRDAFSQFRIPAHLTTADFISHTRRVLAPGGLYLANTADHPPLTLTRREVATALEYFSHVSIITEPGILRGRRYGNVVIIGSDRPLHEELHRVLRTLPTPARLLTGHEIARFVAGHSPIEALGQAPTGLT